MTRRRPVRPSIWAALGFLALLLWTASCATGPEEPTQTASTTTTTTDAMAGTRPGPFLAEGWPAVHHDSSNSDTTPAPAADSFDLAFHALDGWRTLAIPAVANQTVYVTVVDQQGSTCHLAALDAITGQLRWCSSAIHGTAFGSTPVIDRDGHLYIGDDTAMVSLDDTGTELWRTPIDGLPISAQLTGDGRLLFATHTGTVHVLDRTTGEPLISHALVPGLTYDGNWAALLTCPQGSTTGSCPSPNTPAVDPITGRVFVTLNRPGAPDGTLVALQYRGGTPPSLEPVWETTALTGGGAGSPTISADGTRVYTTDRNQQLVAFDAATGDLIWTHPIGYNAGGSPSVNSRGVIVPAGGRNPAYLTAIQDNGDHATTLWERQDVAHRGLAVQPDGAIAYAALVSNGIVHLAVIDLTNGNTRSLTSTETGAWASMGTAVASNGTVYLTTPLNGIYAFTPESVDGPRSGPTP